jgi:adenosylmethionine-8-amino-7-oxononanoate aminotransferase
MLKAVFDACREHDLIFIADEVATGFGRTGRMFAFEHAGIQPDIVCVGKGLTGCSVGLAATVASGKIYEAFHSDDPQHALMHGPTYMGNPIACAAANASIRLFETEPRLEQVATIESHLSQRLMPLADLDRVHSVNVLGAIGAVRLNESVDVSAAMQFFADRGVWIRPVRDTIYLAPAFTIEATELDELCDAIVALVQN